LLPLNLLFQQNRPKAAGREGLHPAMSSRSQSLLLAANQPF